MDTSGRAFVDHWNWAAEKGLMNKNTANGMKAACHTVLSVLEDWETVDVRTLEVDDLVRRFQHLRSKKFNPKSLAEYERRFRTGLASYLRYVDNPGTWKYATTERTPHGAANGNRRTDRRTTTATANDPIATPVAAGTPHELRGTGLTDYPYPLRDGMMIRLALPRDLTKAEVRRISGFMQTLVVDFDAE